MSAEGRSLQISTFRYVLLLPQLASPPSPLTFDKMRWERKRRMCMFGKYKEADSTRVLLFLERQLLSADRRASRMEPKTRIRHDISVELVNDSDSQYPDRYTMRPALKYTNVQNQRKP